MKPEVTEHHPEHKELLVSDPAKWQLPVRLYLEKRTIAEAEEWIANYRMVGKMAGEVIRDRVYDRNRDYCIVCNELIRGGPAADNGYYTLQGEYIHVYICSQGEYGKMMEYCDNKERERLREQERENEAARKALIDLRQAKR